VNDLVHNERVKLTANLLNAAASGMVVTGVVAPLVAVLYGVPGLGEAGALVIGLGTGAWLAASVILHIAARAVLGSLR
jgi:hypothetical protein